MPLKGSSSPRLGLDVPFATVVFATGKNMSFDLNGDWSSAEVSELLGSVEDDRSWRLEVTKEGLAKLTDLTVVPDQAYEDSLHCFFEIWDAGTDFVGPGAASDSSLCKKLERILRENYPTLKGPRTLSAL
jgi:hypothetical protein